MRAIDVSAIEQTVRDLCIEANRRLPDDVKSAVTQAAEQEASPLGREILHDLGENITAAERLTLRQMRRIFVSADEFVAGAPDCANLDRRFDVALVDAQGQIEILENAYHFD